MSLKDRIIKDGFTIKGIAKRMNISRYTLMQKLSNKSEFKASEIVMLKDILNLNKTEINEYFFENKSE